MFVKENPQVIVIFVIDILFTQVMSYQMDLFILTIPVSLIHYCQLNRYCFIFLLSLLAFSGYYKYIFKMNTFINLLLAMTILLTKLTCLRKFFILHISWNSTFLCSNILLNTLDDIRWFFFFLANCLCNLPYEVSLSSIFQHLT